jgi:hypothetical protein
MGSQKAVNAQDDNPGEFFRSLLRASKRGEKCELVGTGEGK